MTCTTRSRIPSRTALIQTAEKFFKFALDKNRTNNLQLRQVVTEWALHNGEIEFAKEQAKEALGIEEAEPQIIARSPIGRAVKRIRGYVGQGLGSSQGLLPATVLSRPPPTPA